MDKNPEGTMKTSGDNPARRQPPLAPAAIDSQPGGEA
jgi:hypothetical protein